MKRLLSFLLLMAGMVGFQLSTALADGNNWMASVDGNTYVSHMSIPGAHDAGTGHGFASGTINQMGGTYAKCQTLTITEQWNVGVRAFDLRPALVENSNTNSNADNYSDLYIWHGIIQTKVTMQSIMETICDLLDQNPTETAIIICRHETDAYYEYNYLGGLINYHNTVSDNGTKFKNKMTSMFTNNNKIKSHLLTTYRGDLKLDDVRGKIVFLMRDGDLPAGGKVTNWNKEKAQFLTGDNAWIHSNNKSFRLFCVDYYDMSGDDNNPNAEYIAHKTQDIERTLQYTTQEHMNDAVWVMNEASGYDRQTRIEIMTFKSDPFPASAGYASNAQTQNPVVINYLNNTTSGGAGIVWMDYAGVNTVKIDNTNYNVRGLDLCNAIINQNSKPGYTSNDYEEYHRALNSIPNGSERLITTTINGTKYYLKADGYLSDKLSDAAAFTFTYVTGNYNGAWTGWSTPCYGMLVNNGSNQYFTNGPGYSGTAPNQTVNNNGHLNLTTSSRGGWETQVFYQNSEGKFAVRACCVDEGTNWNVYGKAYWDVSGTSPQYTFNRNYIWDIEEAPTPVNVTYNIFKDNQQIGTVTVEQFTGSVAQLPVKYSSSTYGLTLNYDTEIIDTEHTTVNVTADWDELPFTLSNSYSDATWYYLHGQSSYANRFISTNGDNIVWDEGYLNTDAYKWAFMGDPVMGIKIVNKATGEGKYLTNTDPATMSTTEYGWPIREQTNVYANVGGKPAFLLFEPNRNQYLNAQSATLKYWGSTDNGSTFWVEGAALDVTYNIIYNGQTVRTGTGHHSIGDAASVPMALQVPFATYTYSPETITANTTEVNVTVGQIDLPFTPSTSYDDAHWYYLRNHPTGWLDSYNYTSGDNAGLAFVHQANDDVYKWAFIGDPINGFKIVNKATGANKYLKHASEFIMEDIENATPVQGEEDPLAIYTIYIREQTVPKLQAPDGSKSFGIYFPNADGSNKYTYANTNNGRLTSANDDLDDNKTFWVEDPMAVDVAPYFENYGGPFQLKKKVAEANMDAYQAAATSYTTAQYDALLDIVLNNANRVVPSADEPLKVRIKSINQSTYLYADGTNLMHGTEDNASEITLTEGTGENAGKYSMKIGDLYVQQVTVGSGIQVTLGENPYYFGFTMITPTKAVIGNDTDSYTYHQYKYINAQPSGKAVSYREADLNSYWLLEAIVEFDINGDGVLDQTDVDAIASILVHKISESWNEGAADVDGDGEVTLKDITTLVNMLLGR